MAEATPIPTSPGDGEKFPLHRLVWDNKYQELDDLLKKKLSEKEELDPRGR